MVILQHIQRALVSLILNSITCVSNPDLVEGLGAEPPDAKVDHRVGQGATHVELERRIVDALRGWVGGLFDKGYVQISWRFKHVHVISNNNIDCTTTNNNNNPLQGPPPMCLPWVGGVVCALGLEPAGHHVVAHRMGERQVVVALGGHAEVLGEGAVQMPVEETTNRVHVVFRELLQPSNVIKAD